jgi:LPS-assembly protein
MPDPLLRLPLSLALLCVVLLSPATSPAARKPLECPSDAPVASGPRPKVTLPSYADLPTEVYADEIRATLGAEAELRGNVEVQRGLQRVTAEALHYDKRTDEAQAPGRVTLEDARGARFETTGLVLHLGERRGQAGLTRFNLAQSPFFTRYGRGDAQSVSFEDQYHTRLREGRFTACKEGQDDWFLHVKELELDTYEDIGTAWHSWLEFKGVPVFYFPYVNFPISDQRKSGVLMPRVGYSGQHGYEAAVPYYFNLAPNYDDTLTPRLLTKRGLQLRNDFRYLGPNSDGRFEVEVLPNDQKFGDDRAAGSLTHQNSFDPYWSANVKVQAVSDKYYLDDFGESVGVTAQTHLPQNGEINHRGPNWNLTGRVADYQTIDTTLAAADRPYARLPQLLLTNAGLPRPNRLNPQLESEWVRFYRPGRVEGDRATLGTSLDYPLTSAYGFLAPRVTARYLGYDLNRTEDPSPSLVHGVASLDSGLFFERDMSWFGRTYAQTLEPRLFYLYSPYKNQDSLPNFDTNLADLSFANLFRENRFIGGDRLGDANQLSWGLASRFLEDEGGAERLRLGLGRIQYFDDRRVNLPPGVVQGPASDYLAEVAMRLQGNWYTQATAHWSAAEDASPRRNVYLQYNPDPKRIVIAGYRYQRGDLSQTDLATEWPVTGPWTVRARSLYSQRDHRNVESYLGFDYNACCWAARAFLTRRYTETRGQVGSIQFEFEFSGLSRRGRVPVSPLTQSVFSFPQEPPPDFVP